MCESYSIIKDDPIPMVDIDLEIDPADEPDQDNKRVYYEAAHFIKVADIFFSISIDTKQLVEAKRLYQSCEI